MVKGWKTEDRRQKTEDGRKMEDRRGKREEGRGKTSTSIAVFLPAVAIMVG